MSEEFEADFCSRKALSGLVLEAMPKEGAGVEAGIIAEIGGAGAAAGAEGENAGAVLCLGRAMNNRRISVCRKSHFRKSPA